MAMPLPNLNLNTMDEQQSSSMISQSFGGINKPQSNIGIYVVIAVAVVASIYLIKRGA